MPMLAYTYLRYRSESASTDLYGILYRQLTLRVRDIVKNRCEFEGIAPQ